MNRRKFIQAGALGFGGLGLLTSMQLNQFKNQFSEETDVKMPVLFIGHGNPMNAIEDNEFSRGWADAGKLLTVPKAILCVSAHWLTRGTRVCAVAQPETIHDFGGFPQALFDVQYNAPGSPEFALETQQLITKTKVELDNEWGLDHGCWSVLNKMFPAANIPVFQLSIDYYQTPQYHYELAQQLKDLRKKGVLIIGSGNIVHNLRLFTMQDIAFDWAIEFDTKIKELLEKGDHDPIINYKTLGKAAELSVPTNDHYLPLLYSIALQEKNESLQFFNDKTTAGSISMRSLKIG
ncbi:MAG: 4,5-DOPA dioxygenase extradiol [Chitinophagales bacterium]|nr:4,5-DOPA dioxygenase extradiol [Bacteroidota bacterium]